MLRLQPGNVSILCNSLILRDLRDCFYLVIVILYILIQASVVDTHETQALACAVLV